MARGDAADLTRFKRGGLAASVDRRKRTGKGWGLSCDAGAHGVLKIAQIVSVKSV